MDTTGTHVPSAFLNSIVRVGDAPAGLMIAVMPTSRAVVTPPLTVQS
jgi:hypothetical protein